MGAGMRPPRRTKSALEKGCTAMTGAELRIGGESGDARTISAKLFLHAFVVLRQRLCLRCITDLYSTSCDLSAQMQTLELCGGVETVTQEQNVREQIETGVEVSAVLCAEVHFGSVSLVQEESTANVRCTAILRVLYLDEGGAPLMVERRTEVAARIAVPEGCTAAVRCVTACEVSAAATADGIEVRFPALFTLECTRRCRCACLCALKAEPQQESGGRQPTLVLRAMGAQERLWDLAKAYRTTVAEILTANELSAEADAPGGEMLLVGVDARHVSSEERLNGFAEYFRKRGTDVSHVIYGKGSHELTYRQTRDMIAAREHISGIFVSGAGLSGAAHAVDDAGLTGRIKVVGFDITESNMSFLKKGTVQFLIDQGPYMQGYRSVQLLTEAIFRDTPVETSFVDTGIQIKNPYNC